MKQLRNYLQKGSLAVIAVLLGGIVVLATPHQTAAVDANDFQAGNIISDEIFTNRDSLSIGQIQAFLDSKVPDCDTNGEQNSEMNNSGVPDYNNNGTIQRWEWGKKKYNQTKFPCLKDYTVSGKSSARIIYDAAQEFVINPKVLIVLLQKEQALVTDTWPLKLQYRSATGYGCPDSAPCDSDYYGLINQIRWSARMFRAIMNDSPTWYTPYDLGNNSIPYNPDTDRCGYSTVNIQNRATKALYNYTPYRPNKAALNAGYGTGDSCSSYGNRNFFLYFNDWFGPIEGSPIISCSSKAFLLEAGQSRKRLIPAATLSAWGIESGDIEAGTDYLCSMTTFAVDLGTVAKSRSTGRLYVIDGGKAFSAVDQSTQNAWGLDKIDDADIPVINGSTFNTYLDVQGELPRIATSTNPSITTVYLIDADKRYTISGTDTGNNTSLSLITGQASPDPIELSPTLLQTTAASGSIDISFTANDSRYLINYGSIRRIEDGALANWHSLSSGTPELSKYAPSLFVSSGPIGSVFKQGSTYYLLDGSTTLRTTTDANIAKNWSSRYDVGLVNSLVSKILAGATVGSNLTSVSGNLRLIECSNRKFVVEKYIKTKRGITAEGISEWGFTNKYFYRNDAACSYPTYEAKLGTLIRSRNSGRVYYVVDQKAYAIDDQDDVSHYGLGGLNLSGSFPQLNSASITDNLTVIN